MSRGKPPAASSGPRRRADSDDTVMEEEFANVYIFKQRIQLIYNVVLGSGV